MYIWQQDDWPQFRYDMAALVQLIGEVRKLQGRLLGHTECLDHEASVATQLDTLVQEAIETSAIEGESLNHASVRSSAARRLGLEASGVSPKTEGTDQLVTMLADAAANTAEPLTPETLYVWQASLFPERPILMPSEAIIGGLRQDLHGHPMAVVSQSKHREIVHFVAPPSEVLEEELATFLTWFNKRSPEVDGLVRAGIAHLWLVTLHPFSDGNGRVTRAVADRALAQDEGTAVRFYSMSAAIMRDRSRYYDMLEDTQKGDLDVTAWLHWFLSTLKAALERSLGHFLRTLDKSRYWKENRDKGLNERQMKVLNRLLDAESDEFSEGLTARAYKSIAGTSKPTATRDLSALVQLGCLVPLEGGGRNTRYAIRQPDRKMP
ncbi:Fic family protein [Cobetia crustatorum]|uniref:Fic family protein n=1 Tax=Cobetia crustatorum TaxID=553385 RepID=A0A558HLW1_9GAMM|nr:Fic family protein [Cobetia crustatorum]TVU70113.1 Fic family protein [Cobetia crustatorum]